MSNARTGITGLKVGPSQNVGASSAAEIWDGPTFNPVIPVLALLIGAVLGFLVRGKSG